MNSALPQQAAEESMKAFEQKLAEYGQYRWSEGVTDAHFSSSRQDREEAAELSVDLRAMFADALRRSPGVAPESSPAVPVVPAGYALVPVDPTTAMLDALADTIDAVDMDHGSLHDAYAAMLASTPAAAAEPTEPTQEMVAAAWREASGKCDHETIRRMYRAMFAASQVSQGLPSPHVDPIDTYKKPVEMEEEIRHGVMVDAPLSERAELLAALTEAYEAIQGAGRKYGEVGTQDCDITDHNTRMDRALLAISSVLNKLAPHVYGAPAPASGLSNFIRNATPAEKEKVYSEVMDKVIEQQRAVIAAAGEARLSITRIPGMPAAPIQLGAIEDALNDALVSWHEISGIPADPAELFRLAAFLTAAVIESPPDGVMVDALSEVYISGPYTVGKNAGRRSVCELATGRVLGYLADGVLGTYKGNPE